MFVVRIFALILLAACAANAHAISQVAGRFTADTARWEIDIDLDIGIAERAWFDTDTPQKPREYLLGLTAAEHEQLRTNAETVLREMVVMSSGKYEVTFPDYESSPPDFPNLLSGGAYLSVVLSGKTPTDAPLVLSVNEGDWPLFVAMIGEEGEAADTFLSIMSGTSETLLFAEDLAKATAKSATQESTEPDPTAAPTPVESSARTDWAGLIGFGFRHVLPDGLDHILFILGICLAAGGWRHLLAASITFTVAHSVTLGLVSAGIAGSSQWVEVGIAASIVIMALAAIRERKSPPRWQLGIIFALGLLHGLGFGSVMSGYFGGNAAFLPVLVALNFGVELAQVCVILAFLAIMALARKCQLAAPVRWLILATTLIWGIYLTITYTQSALS